jgi:isopenicillin N synthase-like dioxygenase
VSAELIRLGEAIRNPAHSDLSTFTLLFQRDVGGLQVADMSSTNATSSAAVNESASFLDVEPNSTTILVNVGYLLMRWTNRRWKNTVHRVVKPPLIDNAELEEPASAPERYSVAFFSFPDEETMVEPFKTCFSDEDPKRWGRLHAGQYLRRKRNVLSG